MLNWYTYLIFKHLFSLMNGSLLVKRSIHNAAHFSGNSGDSLAYRRGMPFTTRGQDNDNHGGHNCAIKFKGAWWYKECHYSNLNGLYLRGSHSSFADGVNWFHWKGYNYPLKRTEMKIRPVKFMAQQWNGTNLTKKRVSRSSIFSVKQSLFNWSLTKRCSGFFLLLWPVNR